MNVAVSFAVEMSTGRPTPAVFLVEAHSDNRVSSAQFSVLPEIESEVLPDLFGNRCRRLVVPGGEVQIEYRAVVDVPVDEPPGEPSAGPAADPTLLPAEVLVYTLPSRYCPSDRLANMAVELFGSARSASEKVDDIHAWINEHVFYQYGTSTVSTSAFETATERVGVCRDFAHLGIAFCRALHIPARYVSGYCLGLETQDLHAYVEAYVDGRWRSFDATSSTPRRALIKIAAGLDAATCAWCTFYGDGGIWNMMAVNVEPA